MREVATAGIVVLSPKGLQVQSAGVVRVGLGDLAPAHAVVMKTLDARSAEIGSPIRRTVQRIVGASR